MLVLGEDGSAMTGRLRGDDESGRVRRIQELRRATNEPGQQGFPFSRVDLPLSKYAGDNATRGIAKLRQRVRRRRKLYAVEMAELCAPISC
jgi:hypothetical protein